MSKNKNTKPNLDLFSNKAVKNTTHTKDSTFTDDPFFGKKICIDDTMFNVSAKTISNSNSIKTENESFQTISNESDSNKITKNKDLYPIPQQVRVLIPRRVEPFKMVLPSSHASNQYSLEPVVAVPPRVEPFVAVPCPHVLNKYNFKLKPASFSLSGIYFAGAILASAISGIIIQKIGSSRITKNFPIFKKKDNLNLPKFFFNDDKQKKKNDKILELQIIGPFYLGAPILLCRNDINVEKGAIGELIEIISFDRILVDFNEPFVFKNKEKNSIVDPKALASKVKSESIILLNCP